MQVEKGIIFVCIPKRFIANRQLCESSTGIDEQKKFVERAGTICSVVGSKVSGSSRNWDENSVGIQVESPGGGIRKVSLPAAEKKKGKTGCPLNPCLCVNPMLC